MKHGTISNYQIFRNASLLLLLMTVCMWTTAAAAQTVYVTDILRLAMRTGPGTGYETVAVVQSGDRLETIATDGDWTQVRMPDGKEGWVLQRYLVPNRTSKILLESLEQKHAALSQQASTLMEENKTLKNENKTLQAELTQNKNRADKASQAYEDLKKEAAQYLKLKTQFQNTSAQLAKSSKATTELQEKLEKMETRQTIRWFITGAAVLLIGLLIGLSMRRQRRRPSLM